MRRFGTLLASSRVEQETDTEQRENRTAPGPEQRRARAETEKRLGSGKSSAPHEKRQNDASLIGNRACDISRGADAGIARRGVEVNLALSDERPEPTRANWWSAGTRQLIRPLFFARSVSQQVYRNDAARGLVLPA